MAWREDRWHRVAVCFANGLTEMRWAADATAARVLVGALALRVALVLSGAGAYLQWRVEVSTPANSLASVREGLLLQRLGVSPWAGSQCRTPPLVLYLHSGTAHHEHLYAAPNILLDMLAGQMLRGIAGLVLQPGLDSRHGAQGVQVITPNTVMAMFLLNPFTIATCVAGTTSCGEVCAAIALLWLAARRRWLAASVALALAVYMGPHAALLLVPSALLLMTGPEQSNDLNKAAGRGDGNSSAAEAALGSSELLQQQQQQQQGSHGTLSGGNPDTSRTAKAAGTLSNVQQSYSRRALSCLALALLTTALLVCLVLLSDWQVVGLQPAAGCSRHAQQLLSRVTRWPDTSRAPAPSLAGSEADVQECWAHTVYRLHVLIEDQTPNIGQLWYLFTEMFTPYLALFRFVAHSLAAIMVVPLALRFPHRPVFLFTCQCLINCMFKPYPSVADHALYLALLPLLRDQMALLQNGMLLGNSFLLLAVLEGAMWHQWINIESANSNFYYSITLLIGAWQTVLLVQLCLLTVRADRMRKQQGNKAYL